MSFLTVLEKAGEDIVDFFKKAEPIVSDVQAVAAPFETLINPALPGLINLGISAITNAQALAATAGTTDQTGAVKLAAVISSLATSAGPTLSALGVNPATVTSAQWTTFVNALVAATNAFEVTQTVPVVAAPVAIASAKVAIPTIENNQGLVLPVPTQK
jgi:hypothetical protein